MPNQITSAGLETKTLTDIVTDLTTAFQTIYGPDINTNTDTPDGQLINIIAQTAVDNLDLLTQVNASFDPDQAIGRTLDERCAINGIERLGGTFSFVDILVTVDRSLTLTGLDDQIDNPDATGYTVADGSGTQWILATSQSPAVAGSYTYSFRAANNGAVETIANSIIVPVTIVLGVTAVNNPSTVTTLGINEETDAALRLRRKKSVALSSQGYMGGLLANLLNINEVTSAYVYENNSGSTDTDGVPGHSIWVIVDGGADADIGAAIYAKRNAGCGMKGSEIVQITQEDGTIFEVLFDRVSTENLYMKFTIDSMNGDALDSLALKQALVAALSPGVYEAIDINEIATTIQSLDSNILVTNCGLGLTGSAPWSNVIYPTSKAYRFVLDTARIAVTRRYEFTVSSASATAGATYTHNGVTYTVETTLVSGSALVCYTTSDTNPLTSGTLTKASGSGDSSISFSAVGPA